MRSRSKHLVGVFTTIVTAIVAIWVGPTAVGDTATKISQSLIIVVGLVFSASKLTEIKHIFLAVVTLVGAILTFVAFGLPKESALVGLIPTTLAVMSNLQKALGKKAKVKPRKKKGARCALDVMT